MKDISHNNCKIGIIFIHVLISLKYSNGDYQFPLPLEYCSVETMFNGCQLTAEHHKKVFKAVRYLFKYRTVKKVI